MSVGVLAIVAGNVAADAKDLFPTAAGNIVVETIARGLENPWSLVFLPDGRMLVSERPGRMRIVTRQGALSPPIEGVPAVFAVAGRQPGLFDIALDLNFARNQTIYFCYVEPIDGGGRTAVGSARLVDERLPRLDLVRRIFRAHGPVGQQDNFGCRVLQTSDRNLFASVGDYFVHSDEAQNLGNHLGKIIRIGPDGRAPADNPFYNRTAMQPEIWSYGAIDHDAVREAIRGAGQFAIETGRASMSVSRAIGRRFVAAARAWKSYDTEDLPTSAHPRA
jgi:glucose/arabinose dehydrogenase